MPKGKAKQSRRREIGAGLIFLLAVAVFIAALIADFQFISPYTTLEEDLQYLINNPEGSMLSTWFWLASGVATFFSAPLIFLVFNTHSRVLAWFSGLLVLAASACFLMMGIEGFHLQEEIRQLAGSDLGTMAEDSKFKLLSSFRQEQLWRFAGSSGLGAFAFMAGLSRIRIQAFPIMASVLLIICGPALIYFNWTDPDHVLRTAALTGVLVGISVFSLRLVNRGLGPKAP